MKYICLSTTQRKREACRVVFSLAILLSGFSPLFSQKKTPVYPKYEDMKNNIPSLKELLKGQPVDWIVLNTDDVIIAEPVTPRPDTLKKIEKELFDSLKLPVPPTREGKRELAAKRVKLKYLYFNVLDGEKQEKRIHRDKIREIIHHEDLLLRRIELLQNEENLALSFELLFNLKRRKPSWPSIAKTENRQLLFEGKQRFSEKRSSPAFVILEELYQRNPKYPGLKKLFGEIADHLITETLKTNDYRRTRHFIGRLRKREPQHEIYLKWEKDLSARAMVFLTSARKARSEKKHDAAAILVAKAVNIWPATPELQSTFTAMTRRFQTLRVGVTNLPSNNSTYFLPTLTDLRRKYLTETPLFEAQGYHGPPSSDELIHYQTRYFREWEPNDLGRHTIFHLQSTRPYDQPQPVLTASNIAATLRGRLNPKSPHFDERLASYVRSFTVQSPTRLEIRFSRVPPRLESLLNFSLLQADSSNSSSKKTKVISPRFAPHQPTDWTNKSQSYRRYLPEPDNVPSNVYHVGQVVEQTFDNQKIAIQALKRGKIHMLAHLRTWYINQLKEDTRFDIRQYAFPVTHVLQFNPKSEALKIREYRRALRYALNRPRMLKEIVLRTQDGGDPNHGRVVSAPFASKSYATSPTVKPEKTDLLLALALRIVVNRQHERATNAALGASLFVAVTPQGDKNGYLPTLKMVIPPGIIVREVAEKCVENWDRVGIKVQIVSGDKSGVKGDWDIVYRTVKMVDPVVDLWPFLTLENRARVISLTHYPDWLRQELLRLDVARDWSLVTKTLKSLHEHLAKQAQMIPLFEVDDFLAINKQAVSSSLSNSNLRPVHTYQNIEEWIINQSYPKQAP